MNSYISVLNLTHSELSKKCNEMGKTDQKDLKELLLLHFYDLEDEFSLFMQSYL